MPSKSHDKMKTTAIIILVVFAFSCKNRTTNSVRNSVLESKFPEIIDSLNLENLYKETMWFMYCYQCDDTLDLLNPSTNSEHITFGMLELKFDTVRIFKDSEITELTFMFYLNGKKCDNTFCDNAPVWGAVYDSTKQMIYYVKYVENMNYRRDSCDDLDNCKSRFVNPLQPEVLNYINTNKSKLNPWFYSEAKRRGLLSDTLPLRENVVPAKHND